MRLLCQDRVVRLAPVLAVFVDVVAFVARVLVARLVEDEGPDDARVGRVVLRERGSRDDDGVADAGSSSTADPPAASATKES